MVLENETLERKQQVMVNRARLFSEVAHYGQKDLGGQPYFRHPLRVSERFPNNTVLQIAALLHDVVEDVDITVEEIRFMFGFEVAELVQALTREDGELYSEYIGRVSSSWKARWIKMSDLLDNLNVDRLPSMGEREQERLCRYADSLAYLLKRCQEEGELPSFANEISLALADYAKGFIDVWVRDNYLYPDGEHRAFLGTFSTQVEAELACMEVVRRGLPDSVFCMTPEDVRLAWNWEEMGEAPYYARHEGIPFVRPFSGKAFVERMCERVCQYEDTEVWTCHFDRKLGRLVAINERKNGFEISLPGFEKPGIVARENSGKAEKKNRGFPKRCLLRSENYSVYLFKQDSMTLTPLAPHYPKSNVITDLDTVMKILFWDSHVLIDLTAEDEA